MSMAYYMHLGGHKRFAGCSIGLWSYQHEPGNPAPPGGSPGFPNFYLSPFYNPDFDPANPATPEQFEYLADWAWVGTKTGNWRCEAIPDGGSGLYEYTWTYPPTAGPQFAAHDPSLVLPVAYFGQVSENDFETTVTLTMRDVRADITHQASRVIRITRRGENGGA